MGLSVGNYRIYQFGEFRVNAAQRMLSRGEEELDLPPKAVETLIALIERRGEIVSKSEIMDAVWSDSIVEESNLFRYVHLLRATLGKQENGQSYIQTFRRRGYRFSGDVSIAEAARTPGTIDRVGTRTVPDGRAIKEATTGNVVPIAEWQPVAIAHPRKEATTLTSRDVAHPMQAERSRRRLYVIILPLAILAAVVGAAYFFGLNRTASPPLTDKDVILIADFDNRTGDDIFDGTLKKGLEFQLQQSPYLAILSSVPLQETLKLMNRPPDEPITMDIAREICQRRGLKAFVTGSIAPIGSNYALTLQAVNAHTGEVIASEIEEADEREKILAALSRAAAGLREKLGESLQSIERLDAPLELTTSSLEALRLHYLGNHALRRGDKQQAAILFKRAIEIDPNFAYAYLDLAVAIQTRFDDQNTEYLRNIEKAYELRDRVSELERLLITDSYYSTTLDIAKRRDVLLVLKDLYPRDHRVLLRLANVQQYFAEYEQAMETARGAIDLGHPASYLVLIRSATALSHFAEARAAADEALQNGVDRGSVLEVLAELAVASNDQALLEQTLGNIPDGPEPQSVSSLRANLALRAGRFNEAAELLRKQIEVAESRGNRFRAGYLSARLATYYAIFRNCEQVPTIAEKAVSIHNGMMVTAWSAQGLAICGKHTEADHLIARTLSEFPDSTVVKFMHTPIVKAIERLNLGDAAGAIESLHAVHENVARTTATYSVATLRGRAYLALNRGAEAEKEFRQIIDAPGEAPLSPLYPLAYLGLARAQVLTGHPENARQNYERFLQMWKDADSDLPTLIEAKGEYSNLQGQNGL